MIYINNKTQYNYISVSHSKTYGAAVQGIDATLITIEVNVSQGISSFCRLPDNAGESHERIMSALQYNKIPFRASMSLIWRRLISVRKVPLTTCLWQ